MFILDSDDPAEDGDVRRRELQGVPLVHRLDTNQVGDFSSCV